MADESQAITAALTEAKSLSTRLTYINQGAMALAAVVVGLLVTLVIRTQRSPREIADKTPAHTQAAQLTELAVAPVVKPVAPVVAEAPPPKADTVEIGLTASPQFSQFRIDQGPLLSNPYTGMLPRDGRDHEVYVSAVGYFPRVARVKFAKDLVFEIALQKIPDPQTAPPPLPRAARPRSDPQPTLQPLPQPVPTPSPLMHRVGPPPPRLLDRGDPWG
jgi:hypothetical protein